jgi:hypothetical protein
VLARWLRLVYDRYDMGILAEVKEIDDMVKTVRVPCFLALRLAMNALESFPVFRSAWSLCTTSALAR